MAISIRTADKNTLLDTYGAMFNSGTIKVYAGSVPADVNAELGSPTLLGTLTFGATALSQKVEEFAGISVIDEVARKAQD